MGFGGLARERNWGRNEAGGVAVSYALMTITQRKVLWVWSDKKSFFPIRNITVRVSRERK